MVRSLADVSLLGRWSNLSVAHEWLSKMRLRTGDVADTWSWIRKLRVYRYRLSGLVDRHGTVASEHCCVIIMTGRPCHSSGNEMYNGAVNCTDVGGFLKEVGAIGLKQGKCSHERVVIGPGTPSHCHCTSYFGTSEFEDSEIGNLNNKDIFYCKTNLKDAT